MKSLLLLVCAVLFVGILVAGCTTTPAPVPTPVITATPAPTPAPTAAIIVISGPATDPALTGNWNFKGATVGGCNNYNGGYNLTGQTTEFGKTITIGPLASTAMYCADTADLESKYLASLQQTKTYSITNNKMLLRGAGLNELSYDKV
jgi:heat shock protein HslJ